MFLIFLSLFLVASADYSFGGETYDDSVEIYDRSNAYKYFDFVRQWSPNGCYHAQHHCKQLDPEMNFWTIHGLWPSYNATSYPANCKECHFDSHAFDKVIDQMHKRWPTDYSGGDTKFWYHEYCKHGTCCQDVLSTELAYFSAALKLNQKLDMDRALKNAGITPSKTRSYTFSQVQMAMKAAFGVDDATYWCRFSDHKQLLFQISICVDKNLRTMNCPKAAHLSCKSNQPIYFLPFSVLN